MENLFSLVPYLSGGAGVLVIAGILASGYLKAPPDMAYIISGFKKKPKVLIGKAGIKIPFLERKDTLMMKQISIDIKTNGYIPTFDFIGVNIDAVAKIAIKQDEEGLALAMKNFLNMDEEQIVACLTDSLQGNMREIVGTVKLKELCNDRKQFGDQIQEKAQQDMDRLGIQIISCNIQKLEDEKGLIVALGQDNMSQIQKDASIAKANADRDVAIAEAEAKTQANEARVKAETQISERNNALEIKKAELKKQSDIEKAKADAAYKIEEETQRKTTETVTADANITKQNKQIELQERNVALKEKVLDAEIRKQADAEKYAKTQEADANLYAREKAAEAEKIENMRASEAEKYQTEQEADAEKYRAIANAEAVRAKANADAEAVKIKGEAEAEAIRLKGAAEAETIKAKAVAEAEGIEKKAEAMKQMGEASILEMYFKMFPEAIKNSAEAYRNVDNITMWGDQSTQLAENVTSKVTQIDAAITEATGLDLKSILAGFIGSKITGSTDVSV